MFHLTLRIYKWYRTELFYVNGVMWCDVMWYVRHMCMKRIQTNVGRSHLHLRALCIEHEIRVCATAAAQLRYATVVKLQLIYVCVCNACTCCSLLSSFFFHGYGYSFYEWKRAVSNDSSKCRHGWIFFLVSSFPTARRVHLPAHGQTTLSRQCQTKTDDHFRLMPYYNYWSVLWYSISLHGSTVRQYIHNQYWRGH